VRNRDYRTCALGVLFALTVSALCGGSRAAGLDPNQAIRVIADRLAAEQVTEGIRAGYWPRESRYTGSIVTGLAAAYRRMCVPAWREAAIRGGAFIEYATGGYYLRGEDAYAMVMLSEISGDPNDNPYRRRLTAFYESLRSRPGGSMGFITGLKDAYEPSTAVFHMAYHAVASDYVGAADRRLFRGGVVMYLALVGDETAFWPVMSVGLATWALAQTGELDATPVAWWDAEWPVWGGCRLQDLPGLLYGHEREVSGVFYWRFDHTDGLAAGWEGPAAGFTEDTVFALLGLTALARAGVVSEADVRARIDRAAAAVLQAVDADGAVRGHTVESSPRLCAYAGEVLTALCAATGEGGGRVEEMPPAAGVALEALTERWLMAVGAAESCGCADYDGNGRVDMLDFLRLSEQWAGSAGP